MTYQETVEFLFGQLPMFQREGAAAYKPGLETVAALAAAFGNPHENLKVIHVAGTNGKGSTAHTIAAILQAAGYSVGLFTSPHLLDFRERIRVNGEMVSREEVVSFVDRCRKMDLGIRPTFFELSTVMAFDCFSRSKVDFAVIEVGLGGRLDSTNIVRPVLSVITNISLDHTSLLGHTEQEIAFEKAGIIKPGIPVVVGESDGVVRDCFASIAAERGAPVTYADESGEIVTSERRNEGLVYSTRSFGIVRGELTGDCQINNARTILEAVKILNEMEGLDLSAEHICAGMGNVCRLTGLMGRWMQLCDAPLTVCDTGHNPGGWDYLAPQIARHDGRKHVVIGFVNDKDVDTVLEKLTRIENVGFYFTQPSTPRRMPSAELQKKAAAFGLSGEAFDSVDAAVEKALAEVVDKGSEMVFIGGSTFVVADYLSSRSSR